MEALNEGPAFREFRFVAITFTCTCGKTLRVGAEFAGQEGNCPSCGEAIRIPAAEQAPGQFTEQAPASGPRKPTGIEPWAKLAPPVKPSPLPDEDAGEVLLTTHAGAILAEDDDLFVPAPPEIGRVFSAATSLKKHVGPASPVTRAVLSLGLFALILVVGFLFAYWVVGLRGGLRPQHVCAMSLVPGLVGIAVAAFVLWWTRFSHTCSYVGVNGAAVFQCSGKRGNLRRADILLFEDAAELRTSQTRSYTNGSYNRTSYSYTWTDDRGRTIFYFGGRYKSEVGTPKGSDPYYFALMAETAWTKRLARDLESIVKDGDPLFFGLTGGDYVQISPGLLVLVQGGRTLEWRTDQIDKIVIDAGNVAIWEHGAKAGWFVNAGIHQFPYANLGNARFFMMAAEKLLGIRF